MQRKAMHAKKETETSPEAVTHFLNPPELECQCGCAMCVMPESAPCRCSKLMPYPHLTTHPQNFHPLINTPGRPLFHTIENQAKKQGKGDRKSCTTKHSYLGKEQRVCSGCSSTNDVDNVVNVCKRACVTMFLLRFMTKM